MLGWILARREALEEAGGFDSKQIFEDWEMYIRLLEKGWVGGGVNEPLYNYRIRQYSRDVIANIRRKEGINRIYRKHKRLYDHYGARAPSI